MSGADDLCLAYLTCADEADAEHLARTVLGARLAACVNVLPGMRSWYWWEGSITASSEVVLVAKTTRAQQAAFTAAIVAAHRYQVPCVVFVPLSGGHTPFLDWVRREATGG